MPKGTTERLNCKEPTLKQKLIHTRQGMISDCHGAKHTRKL